MTTLAYSRLYLGAITETGRRDQWGRYIQRHAMFGDADVRTSYPYGPREALSASIPAGVHNGWDWAPVPAGEHIPIFAPADGVVQRIDTDLSAANGYAVVLRHGYPWWTFYLHLHSRPTLSIGQAVKAGDRIGIMGTTGKSTGVHLHHAVWEVASPQVWGLPVPAGHEYRSYHHNPADFYVDAPAAALPRNTWMEPSEWGTSAEWEALVAPAYWDQGRLVGKTPGDLDARVIIEDDGLGEVERIEIRRRL